MRKKCKEGIDGLPAETHTHSSAAIGETQIRRARIIEPKLDLP